MQEGQMMLSLDFLLFSFCLTLFAFKSHPNIKVFLRDSYFRVALWIESVRSLSLVTFSCFSLEWKRTSKKKRQKKTAWKNIWKNEDCTCTSVESKRPRIESCTQKVKEKMCKWKKVRKKITEYSEEIRKKWMEKRVDGTEVKKKKEIFWNSHYDSFSWNFLFIIRTAKPAFIYAYAELECNCLCAASNKPATTMSRQVEKTWISRHDCNCFIYSVYFWCVRICFFFSLLQFLSFTTVICVVGHRAEKEIVAIAKHFIRCDTSTSLGHIDNNLFFSISCRF